MRGVRGSGYFPRFIYHHPLFVDAGPACRGVLESMDIAWGCTRLSTKLITKEGHEALKKELDYLWREKRPDTTRKVTWAASLGDRSENADYQYNKKLLREIDRRVRYLRKRLEDMRVVEYMPEQEGRVFFGAWVDIENEQIGRAHV